MRSINKIYDMSDKKTRGVSHMNKTKLMTTSISKSAIPNVLVFKPEPLNGVNHAVEQDVTPLKTHTLLIKRMATIILTL